MRKVVYTLCFMCSVRCPIKVTVEGNEIVSIEGNPYVGAMKGGVCPRGAAAAGLLDDTQRLQAPMVRSGPRGSGQWRKVSWDEALDYTVERCKDIFAEYGSKCAVWCERTNMITDLTKTFVKAIGTPNHFTHDSLCKGSVNTACRSVLGYKDTQISPDYANTKHIVLYGRNLFESIEVKAVNNLLDAIGNGAKMTYIDPRVTITAAKSSRYLMIRPGTDLALNYALMHVIIKERLYDIEYVSRWVDGFMELRTFVDAYTPDWAEAETGIPAKQIVALAHELSAAKPAVIFHYGYRGANHPNEIYFRRSIMILNALMGSIEAKGGIFIKKGPKDAGYRAGLRTYASQKFPDLEDPRRFDGCGQDKYPIADPGHGVGGVFPSAVLNEDPYPIKVLFAFRLDPLYSIPDLKQNLRVFEKLDLIVSFDVNFGGTTWMSDVILPESTFLERSDPIRMFAGLKPAAYWRKQCVTPRYDTKPGWWIVKALAERLGKGEYFPYNSIEDIWEYQLADMGLDLQSFEEKGFVELSSAPIWWDRKDGLKFNTASGKIEFVSSLLEDHGFPSFPPYEKLETPADSFRLMVGRCAAHTHVSTQNNPYLNELVPENVLWINNNRAEALGIKDGDMVEVSSKVGAVKLRAFVTDMIHPEAVFMMHGFGHQEPTCARSYQRGAADTVLQELIMDTIGGSPALDHTLVHVRKV